MRSGLTLLTTFVHLSVLSSHDVPDVHLHSMYLTSPHESAALISTPHSMPTELQNSLSVSGEQIFSVILTVMDTTATKKNRTPRYLT